MNKRFRMALSAALFIAISTAFLTESQLGSVHWMVTITSFIGTFLAWAILLPHVEKMGNIKK
ncbi:hypothetical protein [Lentibacillus sp. CBA3610]|uniref:hypothetical protein n=1 Tax=Lentibacillus sp. CBA3610 TaxID=2518176 RepID=UPI001595DFFD|nr:hypothetical protein [Lentibacillus sp. CBA3610]QKY70635.1 hypothetical protein Len3610_14485 [Lentibacillus sp. CBA3610]